jgi:hypothetical protein
MHVHHKWLVAQKVIVQCRHFDPPGGELCHDRSDLVHGQHEIPHHHALVAHFLEGEPAAERKAGFQLDAVQSDLQIGARQADAVDVARRRSAAVAFFIAAANAGLPSSARAVAPTALERPIAATSTMNGTALEVIVSLLTRDMVPGSLVRVL